MDLNGVIRMVGGLVMRKLMGHAMNKGVNMAFGAEKPKAEMTGDERARHKAAKQQAKRLRQSMKIGRRLW